MKLNLEEQEETIEPVEKTDLIYGIDDRPPFKEALPFSPLFSTFFNFFSKRAFSKQKAHRAKHGGLRLCGHF